MNELEQRSPSISRFPTTPTPVRVRTTAPDTPMSVSPQKRKAQGEHSHSPAMKRVNSFNNPTVDKMGETPVSNRFSSLPSIQPHNKQAYVSVPTPEGWKTPTRPQNTLSMNRNDGYSTFSTPSPKKDKEWIPGSGEESDLLASGRGGPFPPSTGVKTGERDERG